MTISSVLCPWEVGTEYRAVADSHEAAGDIPGRTIDALVEQTGQTSGATLVIILPKAGDEFITDFQRQRFAASMARRWTR